MPARIPWKELFEAASAARARAYAPYSDFQVGAALLTEDGTIFAGGNVENASYGLSICAERNAISRAVLEGHQQVRAVAIVVDTDTPTPPCGMCRQTMAEFAAPGMEVRSRNLEGKELRTTLEKLLPHAFTRAFF
ncbi:MAG: cytidine deaminase [Deltaproteobacteria bacterium]|nr:cytidine deaminase [Deltaproteobacteria bacterium]